MQPDGHALRELIDKGFSISELQPVDIPPREGGVAVVLCGADSQATRFALRITKPHQSPELLDHDFKGYEKAAQLGSDIDGLVRVKSVWRSTQGGHSTNYALMEWCEQSFHEALQNAGSNKEVKFFQYLSSLATSLDRLKARGYVHGDIKETNLLFCNGAIKIADFGSLSVVQDNGYGVQPIVKTPEYAAPEFIQGHLHPSADLYSLAVLYVVHRMGRSAAEARSYLDHDKPLPNLDAEEIRLIRQATHRDPNLRPQNAHSWVTQLQQVRLKPKLRSSAHRFFDPRQVPRVRVGILGVSNAGKTTFLTILCHPSHSLVQRSWIHFHDAESHERLEREFKELLKEGGTASTARATAQPFQFSLFSQSEAWEVETIDYAGEMIMLLQQDALARDSRNEMLSRLSRLDAIMVIVDSTDSRHETLSTWNTIVPLIKRHIRSAGTAREPAIAFVFTKADQVAEKESDHSTSFDQQITAKPLFASLVSHQNLFKRAEIFLTTALGVVSKEPPFEPDDLTPANILAPWEWCCEKACEGFRESMHQSARQIRDRIALLYGLPVSQQSVDLLGIERRIRQFSQEFGPPHRIHDEDTTASYHEEYRAFRSSIHDLFWDEGYPYIPPFVRQIVKCTSFPSMLKAACSAINRAWIRPIYLRLSNRYFSDSKR